MSQAPPLISVSLVIKSVSIFLTSAIPASWLYTQIPTLLLIIPTCRSHSHTHADTTHTDKQTSFCCSTACKQEFPEQESTKILVRILTTSKKTLGHRKVSKRDHARSDWLWQGDSRKPLMAILSWPSLERALWLTPTNHQCPMTIPYQLWHGLGESVCAMVERGRVESWPRCIREDPVGGLMLGRMNNKEERGWCLKMNNLAVGFRAGHWYDKVEEL